MLRRSRRHAFFAFAASGFLTWWSPSTRWTWWSYSRQVYEDIRREFTEFAAKLQIADLTVIPVSALHGDNVVERSQNMPWYEGGSLLNHLENVYIASDRNLVDGRFPVQYVIRPHTSEHHDYRGYAGKIAGGVMRTGDDVIVLPSGLPSRIASIETADGPVDEAFAPMSVTVRLEDDIDISRGDMICRPHNQPTVSQDIDAMVAWMSDEPLRPGQKLALKHTTRNTRALVESVQYELNVNTLHRDEIGPRTCAQFHRPGPAADNDAAADG